MFSRQSLTGQIKDPRNLINHSCARSISFGFDFQETGGGNTILYIIVPPSCSVYLSARLYFSDTLSLRVSCVQRLLLSPSGEHWSFIHDPSHVVLATTVLLCLYFSLDQLPSLATNLTSGGRHVFCRFKTYLQFSHPSQPVGHRYTLFFFVPNLLRESGHRPRFEQKQHSHLDERCKQVFIDSFS